MTSQPSIDRVLIVTVLSAEVPGGIQSHLKLLRKRLTERGIQSEVVDGTTMGTFSRRLRVLAHMITRVQGKREAWAANHAAFLRQEITKRGRFSLIHAHDPVAAVAALGTGMPLVATIHGPMVEHAREVGGHSEAYLAIATAYERVCYGSNAAFIAVDTGQKDILVRKGVDERRIRVIFNSVNVEEVREIAKSRSFSWPTPYFLMARRLVPKNGPRVAVEGFLEWVGDRNVSLLVAGDGPLQGDLVSLMQAHPHGRKVALLGPLDHQRLFPILKGAIASLVPSVPTEGVIEATSLSALESLALDVPVIASRIGGLVEIDAGTGLLDLVPAGDRRSLALRFDHWYERRDQSKGEDRSRHVRDRFGDDKWMEAHLAVYREAVQQAGARLSI